MSATILTIGAGSTIGAGVTLTVPVLPVPTIITSGLQLYLDAGNPESYAPQHTATVAFLTNNGRDIHIPTAFNANIGNQVRVGYPVVTAWGGYHARVTGITTGTGSFGPEWIFSLDTDVSVGYTSGFNVTFGSDVIWTDTIGSMVFDLAGTSITYSSNNGGYLQFNPSGGDHAYSGSTLGTLSAWTIEVWHYYDGTNTGNGCSIFTERYAGGDINLGLGDAGGTDGSILQTYYYRAGFHATNATYSLTPGAWYHVVGTYDGTTLKLYVNETLVNSTTAGTVGTANTVGYNVMSRWDNETANAWGGKLSVVRVYNRALSQADITNNYAAEHTRFGL